MSKNKISLNYDVVIVGGGMSGLVAALASSRHNTKTALIHNRPVLGGNASSEVRMHICGAADIATREDARESGIIDEILIENRYRNPQSSFSVFDTILWEKAHFQDNLDLFLNTHMTNVVSEDNKIKYILAEQLTSEKLFEISGKIFIDATGDATLAYLSGAEYMSGREGKDVFNEPDAVEKSDSYTMGNSLLFTTKDMGKPVPFKKPKWANTYTEDDLKFRRHVLGSNPWWIEIGGTKLDTITDAENIRDELLKAVYGVWDHIKNGGDHGADNYVLDWVGFLPGKRESRRVVGDYVLKEQDLLESKIFEDAVAYGGWPMDLHVMGGLEVKDKPNKNIRLSDIYTIPYRCLYSKNIENLMIGGRAISVSHMAFGSTRVMGTTSIVGQAIGTAASIAIKRNIMPRQVLNHINELQQTLLKDDAFIPGFKINDPMDKAQKAIISCSSSINGGDCNNVTNGYGRKIKENTNCWISDKINDSNEWISLEFKEQEISVNNIEIRFDSNFSKRIRLSAFDNGKKAEEITIPEEMVKDFNIEFYHKDKLVHIDEYRDNYQRKFSCSYQNSIICDKIKITVLSTYGYPHAKIYEIRVY